jgi:CRP-like cAMP-binding protein
MTHPQLDRVADICPLFRGLSAAESSQLTSRLEVLSFGPGVDILVEGTSYPALWVVVQGRCQVVKCAPGSKVLATIEPPGIFGEMSFFHPSPTSATVRAVEHVTAARLSREKFDELEQTFPKIGYRVALNTVAVLSDRLRRMDDWACQFLERTNHPDHFEEWAEFQARLYTDWKF